MKSRSTRETVVYAEKYRRGAMRIRAEHLPVLHHTSWPVDSVELLEAGVVEREGKRLEFQVLRVYLNTETITP